jgi:hypothetical protein
VKMREVFLEGSRFRLAAARNIASAGDVNVLMTGTGARKLLLGRYSYASCHHLLTV